MRPKKRGRPKVYGTTLSVRCHMDDYYLVAARAAYERLDPPELMRMWLNERRNVFRADKMFRAWLEKNRDELSKEGLDVEQIW